MLGNPVQQTKLAIVISPRAILNGSSWTTNELDCKGWDYLQIVFFLGATDIALTALAVTESDTSGSGHSNVTGLISGTSTNTDGSTSALPSATNDNTIQLFEIDLTKRKRYIDLTATIGSGTAGGFAACVAILSRGKDVPVTATERGCDEILRA